jgi:hypothetical protein
VENWYYIGATEGELLFLEQENKELKIYAWIFTL